VPSISVKVSTDEKILAWSSLEVEAIAGASVDLALSALDAFLVSSLA